MNALGSPSGTEAGQPHGGQVCSRAKKRDTQARQPSLAVADALAAGKLPDPSEGEAADIAVSKQRVAARDRRLAMKLEAAEGQARDVTRPSSFGSAWLWLPSDGRLRHSTPAAS